LTRVVADTEKAVSGNLERTCLTIVVLPDPLGAVKTTSFQGELIRY